MNRKLVLLEALGDGIQSVKLNRPGKRNALSIELRETLAETLKSLAVAPACRAVIFSGAGTAFCAGMDFTQFGGGRENKMKLFHSSKNLFSSVLEFPKPVVGAIQGAAMGGGFALALCCDVRIAAEDAFFGFFEFKRGIPAPYDVLREFVNEVKAKELCETGRRMSVQEAFKDEIVKKVVRNEELMDACMMEARSASKKKPPASLLSAFENEMDRFHQALFPG